MAAITREHIECFKKLVTFEIRRGNNDDAQKLTDVIKYFEKRMPAIKTIPHDYRIEFIEKVAAAMHSGIVDDMEFIKTMTPDVIESILAYGKENENEIRDMMRHIGFHFNTHTWDQPMDEVFAVIARVPYIGCIPNETSRKFTIKVCYYENLLRGTNFELSIWMGGSDQMVKFDTTTKKLEVENHTFELKKDPTICSNSYTELYFKSI